MDSSKPAENEPSSLGLSHHLWKLVEDDHIPTSKGHGNDNFEGLDNNTVSKGMAGELR